MTAHVILVRAWAGEHWECSCGRWRFDSDRCLTDAEVLEVVAGEWAEHCAFEDRYGAPRRPHTSPTSPHSPHT